MRVIGVLDLMGGQVVRGVGGLRQEYRPIVSRLTDSSEPLDVACAFHEHFGLNELYVADLDAIAGSPPAWETYRQLQAKGFRLWVDAGVRNAAESIKVGEAGVQVVVGLETVAGPAALAEAAHVLGQRLVFSLDLREGLPLGNRAAWNDGDAGTIADRAISLGVRRLLILDLARVGSGSGPGSRALCRRLVADYPHVEVSTGGGVRGRDDLEQLRDDGVAAVLLASALHDGRLGRDDIQGL
jgi:phosphoribosylformimino-5-aminoimidazole carboxamide ribotide isomerase